MSSFWWRFAIFGLLGTFAEVYFTALKDLIFRRSFRLHGFSFIWMFPLYGLLAILFPPVFEYVQDYSLWVRGIAYMGIIYGVEFVAGSILTAVTGSHIWDYSHHRFNFRGQISLWYAPIWFGVGILVERYFPWVEKAARALSPLS